MDSVHIEHNDCLLYVDDSQGFRSTIRPSKYCSQIIEVHVHANGFSLKFTQHVTILQTISNQEVTKHAADCSNAVCWGVK